MHCSTRWNSVCSQNKFLTQRYFFGPKTRVPVLGGKFKKTTMARKINTRPITSYGIPSLLKLVYTINCCGWKLSQIWTTFTRHMAWNNKPQFCCIGSLPNYQEVKSIKSITQLKSSNFVLEKKSPAMKCFEICHIFLE